MIRIVIISGVNGFAVIPIHHKVQGMHKRVYRGQSDNSLIFDDRQMSGAKLIR